LRIDHQVEKIRAKILKLSEKLYDLVQPTQQELDDLRADLVVNPEIYASYLIDEDLDGDKLWIAENVYDERESHKEN